MGIEILTFGCRLNISESEVIRREAAAAGLDKAVIVNTCAVTHEAVSKARQAIRKIARERPGVPVVVTGCAAQTEPQNFAGMPEVARVLGNAEKLRLDAWAATRTMLTDGLNGIEEKIAVNDIMAVKDGAAHLIEGLDGYTRAFVQVQNGCDHRCTFCVIPYGRGNSRSVPMGKVVTQIRSLVSRGYREVVLTGVDLTSYGVNLRGQRGWGTS